MHAYAKSKLKSTRINSSAALVFSHIHDHLKVAGIIQGQPWWRTAHSVLYKLAMARLPVSRGAYQPIQPDLVPVQIKKCEVEMTLAAPFAAYIVQIIAMRGTKDYHAFRWSAPTSSFFVGTSLSCASVFLYFFQKENASAHDSILYISQRIW